MMNGGSSDIDRCHLRRISFDEGCGGVSDRGYVRRLLLARFCGAGEITSLIGFGGRCFEGSLRLSELKNVFGCLDLREEALIACLLQGDAGMSPMSAAQFAREC